MVETHFGSSQWSPQENRLLEWLPFLRRFLPFAVLGGNLRRKLHLVKTKKSAE